MTAWLLFLVVVGGPVLMAALAQCRESEQDEAALTRRNSLKGKGR